MISASYHPPASYWLEETHIEFCTTELYEFPKFVHTNNEILKTFTTSFEYRGDADSLPSCRQWHIESVYLNLDMQVKLHLSFFDLTTQAIVVMCWKPKLLWFSLPSLYNELRTWFADFWFAFGNWQFAEICLKDRHMEVIFSFLFSISVGYFSWKDDKQDVVPKLFEDGSNG